jgi:hypothetical protein
MSALLLTPAVTNHIESGTCKKGAGSFMVAPPGCVLSGSAVFVNDVECEVASELFTACSADTSEGHFYHQK